MFFLAGAQITLWAENGSGFLTHFRIALVCRNGTVPKQIVDEHPILQSYRDSFQFVTQPEGSEEISSTVIRQAFLENRLDEVKAFLHPAVWERFQSLSPSDSPSEIEKFQGKYEFLNNSFPCSFQWHKQNWRCAEAAIQAARCADSKEALTFVNSNAEKAKARVSKVIPRADWSDVCLTLVEEILRAKFTQNKEPARQLHETSASLLVFGTNNQDNFWAKDLFIPMMEKTIWESC